MTTALLILWLLVFAAGLIYFKVQDEGEKAREMIARAHEEFGEEEGSGEATHPR